MKRALVSILLACSTVVHAAPHTVLVLRAEGTADATSRNAVETHVIRLAKNIEGKVDQGDITLSDAGAAAGCDPAEARCKDAILDTFAVDEIVTTMTVAGQNGAVNVTVRRITKGKTPRVAWTILPAGQVTAADAKLNSDIGPLFGAKPAAAPPPPVTPPPSKAEKVEKTDSTDKGGELARDLTGEKAATPPPPPAVTEPQPQQPYPDTTGTAAPITTAPVAVDGTGPNRKWQKIGMGVGAGMALLGVLMWSSASSKQDEIDSAPADTPTDFIRLQELEDEADGLAGGGNLFFLAGAALGGVSAYFYWKKGRDYRTQTARITPTVFPGGGGVVLTFGGAQ